MNNKEAWRSLDADLHTILESTLMGSIERKVEAMGTIIYTFCKERFGVGGKQRNPKNVVIPNRRQDNIQRLRRELKAVTRQYRRASDIERIGLHQLRDDIRENLARLRKAEQVKKARKDRARKRESFIKDPYSFTKTLLGGERSGRLDSSTADIEQHLRETHGDEDRGIPLGNCPRIEAEEPPEFPLDTKEPTWKEIQDVVKKARTGSAPGPSGIPYKVYKKCPRLLRRLWQLLRKVWKKGKIPPCWQKAEGCFVPKEKDSKHIGQFRTISLLSVEGKIFFAVLARRMTSYMMTNGYIDTSVQKGGIPGFSGCVEHTSVLSQLIREAKSSRGNLTVVWLDLANAYGSIPHELIEVALQHYFIPEHIQGIVRSYFSGIQVRFTVGEDTTSWQNMEKGIVTGCTISVILFVMGMNLIIKAAGRETRGPRTESGIYQPSNRGFMDDLTVTTTTHVQARWVLSALEEVVSWARMKFKARKSRCMIMRKGRLTQQFKLKVQGEEIPSIADNPIKCLGKWFDASLKDTSNISSMQKQAIEWMRKIDKSGLPGKFKAWRWLGVPSSFSSIGLYSRTSSLQLPLSSLVKEFKVTKARLVMTLRDSKDVKIRNAGIQTRTGRKWSASQSVEQAEGALKHRDIVGATCSDRQGLGTTHFQTWEGSDDKEKRSLVQGEIRREEEGTRKARAVEMGSQGAWTKWKLPERKLTWTDLWRYEPLRIQFLLRSVYNTLPSPANLHLWGLVEEPKCQLCQERGTMGHILSACKTALTQGRYRWRHDQVLRELADVLEVERKKKRPPRKHKPSFIRFVKAGEKETKATSGNTGILEGAEAWEMRVDLGKKLVFPDVVQTTLRPDVVIWSAESRQIIVIELRSGAIRPMREREPSIRSSWNNVGSEGGFLAVSCGGRMQRVPGTLSLEDIAGCGISWKDTQDGGAQASRGCRARIMLVVEQTGGERLEAIH
ncbi:uncharacterized protein LOC110458420 [Mizuhopecten yessoensis]|uniref:uncharacterized protein LOC110458420 n=1 Tax=Mizuhopecten yessoensis TaxID=6573 RepID=UPI000B459E8A|nr:uncharacterized protein LOC110458420 [Mizuhopecten yessoensis]